MLFFSVLFQLAGLPPPDCIAITSDNRATPLDQRCHAAPLSEDDLLEGVECAGRLIGFARLYADAFRHNEDHNPRVSLPPLGYSRSEFERAESLTLRAKRAGFNPAAITAAFERGQTRYLFAAPVELEVKADLLALHPGVTRRCQQAIRYSDERLRILEGQVEIPAGPVTTAKRYVPDATHRTATPIETPSSQPRGVY